MKSIQITAKNVQKAIEMGLKELNASQEDVDIKILDEGGLFRKAKVELVLDKEVEEKKIKETEETKVFSLKEEKSLNNFIGVEKIEETKEEIKKDVCNLIIEEQTEEIEKKEEKPKKINLSEDEIIEKCKSFLKILCEKMKVEANIEAFKSEQGILFNANGEKVSSLIGKRGETLNAIQEILSNFSKNNGYKERVFFDVENYKNRREMSLIGLAERMANKAIKINKPIKLEKMSAYERKIIHTAIQNFKGVTSKSEGEEPNRRLVIFPVQEEKE